MDAPDDSGLLHCRFLASLLFVDNLRVTSYAVNSDCTVHAALWMALSENCRTLTLLAVALVVWYASLVLRPSNEGALLLQSPMPVTIALPNGHGFRRSGRYSHWRCVGGLEDADDFEHRACVFTDVCYDIQSSDFLYFAPEGSADAGSNVSSAIVYDHRRGAQHTFRHRVAEGADTDADFVALSKWVPYRQRLSWSPRTVHGQLPSRHERLRGLTALSAPFVPTNLGHVAWDEAFPLLVAMAQLGVYTPTLRILRTEGCDALPGGASRRICAKFAAAFLHPLLGARHATLLTLPQLVATYRRERVVCFDQLLVGGAFDAFNSDELNHGKEPLLALYRARVLAWHGLSPTVVPRQHAILLVEKAGRRGIHNFREVKAHVESHFGGIAQVRTSSFAALTMAEQLRLVASTTVAVSPCGGVSMILPFLPEGAHAVLMNYMVGERDARRHGECEGCSWTMEAELWRHVRHVHKQYYQVWGPADFAGGKPGRDSAVVVDPGRLDRLIAAALNDMQP